MTTFGDKIKDLPVDKDESKSPNIDLVNSIFDPKDSSFLSKEIKLLFIGIVLLYALFTPVSQSFIFNITKNDNMAKAMTGAIVIIVLFLLNKSTYL